MVHTAIRNRSQLSPTFLLDLKIKTVYTIGGFGTNMALILPTFSTYVLRSSLSSLVHVSVLYYTEQNTELYTKTIHNHRSSSHAYMHLCFLDTLVTSEQLWGGFLGASGGIDSVMARVCFPVLKMRFLNNRDLLLTINTVPESPRLG